VLSSNRAYIRISGYFFLMGDITSYTGSTGRMTSLEISELTGKAHDKVMRDIDKLFKEL
jgi:hypothetical protein